MADWRVGMRAAVRALKSARLLDYQLVDRTEVLWADVKAAGLAVLSDTRLAVQWALSSVFLMAA
jgi:hypothetical protein